MNTIATPARRIRNRAAGASRPSGKSPAELVRASNRWRDSYNALRNLAISRVVTLLESAQRGDYAELQLVLERMERRFPVLKALKARRLAALESLDWDIKIANPLPAGLTEAQAEAQRAHLRTRYDLLENLTDAIGQLVLAEFRGYTILQKHRFNGGLNDGAVRELHWLPQYTWARDGRFGDWFYNADSRFGIAGDTCLVTLGEANRIGSADLPREDFVIREHDTPLYEIALIAFVNWSMGRKDWAAFVEIFGLPNAIIVMPPNIPSGKEDEYLAAAEKVADGVSGALPSGSDAKFPTASVRGSAPFKEFCDAMIEDVVLAGTGGLLTMLSQPTGIGQGASGEHGDAFSAIAQADARRVNETLQRDFDRAELAEAFPGQPPAAYFEMGPVEQDDITEIITQIAALKSAGFSLDSQQVAEKTGYEIKVLPSPAPGQFGVPALAGLDLHNRATASPEKTFALAVARKLDPVAATLNRIVEIKDDAAMVAALQKFLAASDAVSRMVTADVTQTARELEAITAQNFVRGLEGGPA